MTVFTKNGWEVDVVLEEGEETELGDGLFSVQRGSFIVNIKETEEGVIIDIFREEGEEESLASCYALKEDL
jgi:hypothetical protein